MLDETWVGRKFLRYTSKKEYTIVDMYTTTNLAGDVISQTYVTENDCVGQIVRGELPKATIDRSVLLYGWR